jgi:PAS domain S-box-containing protein
MGVLDKMRKKADGHPEQKAPGAPEDIVDLDNLGPSPQDSPTPVIDVARYPEPMLFQELLDTIPDRVYFKDLQSRFIALSRTMEAMQGAIGKTDFDVFTDEHARKAYEDEQDIIATGNPIIDKEEKETWPDGRVSWVLTSKFPLRDPAGRIIGTFGVSRDITARKKAEEELKASEDQLRQSHKMEAFGQLAGGIAHDFNNMLGGILGAAQLMERKIPANDPHVRQYVEMVIETAKRAGDLTARLLAFARKGSYNIVAINLHEVVHSVVGLLQHTVDKRIKIVERLYAGSAVIMGDQTQLQNALLNLAVNARDAMPQGGTLTFETTIIEPATERFLALRSAEVKQCRYLKLQVSDTGVGMDRAVLSRVFEPFFTTKAPGKGTGLGLASVYGTIKSHNGFIEVASEPGKGTTFTVFLPLVDKPEFKQPVVSGEVRTGVGTILVVDDEEVVRRVVMAILNDIGYSVVGCKDGLEAVDYYRDHHDEIDVVIVDMIMPRLGGYDCVRKLKEIHRDVKVVISTGYSLASDTQKIMAQGIAGFIKKPFMAADLSQLLNSIIRGNAEPKGSS